MGWSISSQTNFQTGLKLHEYFHYMSTTETQDISINLLVNFRPGWDMQTVSQPHRVFLCTSSRITIILEKRCVRHGCTHPQHRVTNKEWVSEGIPRLHCHSPKVKHRLSTHVNWLDDCFSFSVHTLTPQQDFSCFDFIGFWLARQGWSSDTHLCCSHICLLSANSYTAQLNI